MNNFSFKFKTWRINAKIYRKWKIGRQQQHPDKLQVLLNFYGVPMIFKKFKKEIFLTSD